MPVSKNKSYWVLSTSELTQLSPSMHWTQLRRRLRLRLCAAKLTISKYLTSVFCIYPCPKCRLGFCTHEYRWAKVGSDKCTRVQVSVQLLPEARGWQCVLCNRHIKRRDVKMHLRVHNRGEIPGNMNNVWFCQALFSNTVIKMYYVLVSYTQSCYKSLIHYL